MKKIGLSQAMIMSMIDHDPENAYVVGLQAKFAKLTRQKTDHSEISVIIKRLRSHRFVTLDRENAYAAARKGRARRTYYRLTPIGVNFLLKIRLIILSGTA